jgi:hypothetical protein
MAGCQWSSGALLAAAATRTVGTTVVECAYCCVVSWTRLQRLSEIKPCCRNGLCSAMLSISESRHHSSAASPVSSCLSFKLK